MGLIQGTAHKVQVPHEQTEENGGPHWVEIRKLSGSEMDEASQAQTQGILDRMGDMIGSLSSTTPPTMTDEEKNSLLVRRATYDPEVLIRHALVSWSYHEDKGPDPGSQLDAVTRDWLWETIVDENTHPPVPLPSGGQD